MFQTTSNTTVNANVGYSPLCESAASVPVQVDVRLHTAVPAPDVSRVGGTLPVHRRRRLEILRPLRAALGHRVRQPGHQQRHLVSVFACERFFGQLETHARVLTLSCHQRASHVIFMLCSFYIFTFLPS